MIRILSLLLLVPVAAPAQEREKLRKGNEKFAFDLYGQIVKSRDRANVFVSPTSVSLALAMTWNGSGGTTREAMAKALGLEGLTIDEANRAFAALLSDLQGVDPMVKLEIADSIWVAKDARIQEAFRKRVADAFHASAESADFRDPATVKTINAWVSAHTAGKIPQIVDDTIRDKMVILLNAVYFKAAWRTAFDPKKTREMPFHLADGKEKKVPMMARSAEFDVLETKTFRSIRLPYGKSDRCSMLLFVPTNLSEFHRELTAANLESWLKQYHKADGSVLLPRFKLEFTAPLKEELSALGMSEAFSTKANFREMVTGTDACISQVTHKTFVEVNEEGTEAAAVTKVDMTGTGVHRSFDVVADRPFFFLIRDDKTGAILFMGSIFDP